MELALLTPADLRRRFESGERLIVLDVREPQEREFCAIAVPPAATDLHLPTSEFLALAQELPDPRQAAPIVVYCHHGVRSRSVAAWLLRNGYENIASLEGGIDAWSLDIDPDVPRY